MIQEYIIRETRNEKTGTKKTTTTTKKQRLNKKLPSCSVATYITYQWVVHLHCSNLS